jgi:RNA polymerase sigma factor (sigma-70 family)
LDTLCRTYWYPLYAFIRKQGFSPPDAEDLTQAFFVHLLGNHGLAAVARAKGRFRSFLLASLKNFLANERDRLGAQKRGSGQIHVSIDTAAAETRYGIEPADPRTAERAFERHWAITLLDTVLDRLRAEYAAPDKAKLFTALKFTLTGESKTTAYIEIAAGLGMSEGAIKVAVHRLRQRYRELLRDEVAQTVASPGDVDEELRHIFVVLSG